MEQLQQQLGFIEHKLSVLNATLARIEASAFAIAVMGVVYLVRHW